MVVLNDMKPDNNVDLKNSTDVNFKIFLFFAVQNLVHFPWTFFGDFCHLSKRLSTSAAPAPIYLTRENYGVFYHNWGN